MIIKKLTSTHAHQYQRLRLEALQNYPQAFLSLYENEKQKTIYEFEWEIKSSYPTPFWGYYGVFENQQLLAYLQISKSPLPKQAHLAYVYNLYVSHQHQRQKVGNQLMRFIITQIKKKGENIEQIRLAHNGKNLQAHNFYKSLGFKTEAIKKKTIKYQDEYDDEIEMVLYL